MGGGGGGGRGTLTYRTISAPDQRLTIVTEPDVFKAEERHNATFERTVTHSCDYSGLDTGFQKVGGGGGSDIRE